MQYAVHKDLFSKQILVLIFHILNAAVVNFQPSFCRFHRIFVIFYTDFLFELCSDFPFTWSHVIDSL